MTFRNKLMLASLPIFAAVAAVQPAAAQAPTMTAGAQVKDTAGGDVGTIASVDGQFVVLKTDKHEVKLPASSFTKAGEGYIMAMTRAQVNEAVEKSLAEAGSKLVKGAAVTGAQGAAVGTIDAIDDQYVTLKLTSGKLVRLPRNGIAPGPTGGVVGATAAELEASAAAATAAPAQPEGAATKAE